MNKCIALIVRSMDTDEVSTVSLFENLCQARIAVERDYGVKTEQLEDGVCLVPLCTGGWRESTEQEQDEYPKGTLMLDTIQTTDER